MIAICKQYADDSLAKGNIYPKSDDMLRAHPQRKMSAKEIEKKFENNIAETKNAMRKVIQRRREIPRTS